MDDFLTQMQKYVAINSVGASTVRGQRTPGLVRTLRESLADINLAKFRECSRKRFLRQLDAATKEIQGAMPRNRRYWGIARKVLNIFLRCATYNTYLRRGFRLDRLESWLEIPLDSLTVKGLNANMPPHSLPRWKGVKYVTPDESSAFQTRASELAIERGVDRIHLDIYLWVDRD